MRIIASGFLFFSIFTAGIVTEAQMPKIDSWAICVKIEELMKIPDEVLTAPREIHIARGRFFAGETARLLLQIYELTSEDRKKVQSCISQYDPNINVVNGSKLMSFILGMTEEVGLKPEQFGMTRDKLLFVLLADLKKEAGHIKMQLQKGEIGREAAESALWDIADEMRNWGFAVDQSLTAVR